MGVSLDPPPARAIQESGGTVLNLGAVSNGQDLVRSGATLVGQTPVSGITLGGAYDFGGSGAGRAIVADSGAVTITKNAANANNALELTVTAGSGAALSVSMGAATTGVGLYMNAATGATGKPIQIQKNASDVFTVDVAGATTITSTSDVALSVTTTSAAASGRAAGFAAPASLTTGIKSQVLIVDSNTSLATGAGGGIAFMGLVQPVSYATLISIYASKTNANDNDRNAYFVVACNNTVNTGTNNCVATLGVSDLVAKFNSGVTAGWTSSATNVTTTALDTGLSRLGAASLAIGNGTQGNASGLLQVLQLGVGGVAESTNQLHVYAATAKVAVESTTNTNTAGIRFLTRDSGGTGRNGGLYMIPGTTTSSTWFAWSPTDVNTPWGINQAQTIVGHGSGMIIGWSATANDGTAALDTGLSRTAAATMAIGNGTAGNASGTLKVTAIQAPAGADLDMHAGGGSNFSQFNLSAGTTSTLQTATPRTTYIQGEVLTITDVSAMAAGVGGGITFQGIGDFPAVSGYIFGAIQGFKETGVSGNYLGGLRFFVNPTPGNNTPVEVGRFTSGTSFNLLSTGVFAFTSSSSSTATADVGISRLGAASLAVGNGAAGNATGSIQAAKFAVASSVFWTSGAGSPEGVVSASPGSLYSNTSGGAGVTLYVKESGAGNTGWIAK